MRRKRRERQGSRSNGNFCFAWRRLAEFLPGVFALLLLGALVIAGYFFGWECPFLRLTGIPCPGCGLTRACAAALRADFAEAFRLHFMFPAVPALALFVLFGGRLFRREWLNVLLLCLIALGFGVKFLLAVCGIY